MGNLGATELIIIAVVIILLFGAKKLPDMARSLGRSAKILKAETKGLREDDQPQDTPPQQAAPQQLPPAQPQQVVQQPAQQQPQVAQPIEQSAQNLQNKQN
ncbi:Sec-independent protein translocase subunit TatA [Saccharothrix variisporea]|uniref:Sec-independent protein translocase protein TatA n=1 Tax=Saccharothrix variisporea TaxID=543527 RepID=A0A495X245_9PSEU|nr:Sec-independent protein translocase subunit TatA [Saccharothrix variisporea]RKT68261.1 sec-independent protein translocase protein TatA [Saccharothrix variisporea]